MNTKKKPVEVDVSEDYVVKVRHTTRDTEHHFIDRGSALAFAEFEYQRNRICWVTDPNGESISR